MYLTSYNKLMISETFSDGDYTDFFLSLRIQIVIFKNRR